jgi:hypothetical protein
MTMDLADLRQLLAEEAASLDFEAADPDQLVRIVRLRRRRRAIVGGVLGAAVAVGVVVAVSNISLDAGGSATVVPASPTSTSLSPTPSSSPLQTPSLGAQAITPLTPRWR